MKPFYLEIETGTDKEEVIEMVGRVVKIVQEDGGEIVVDIKTFTEILNCMPQKEWRMISDRSVLCLGLYATIHGVPLYVAKTLEWLKMREDNMTKLESRVHRVEDRPDEAK